MKLTGKYWKPAGHGYILANECMYQVQGNDTNNWKVVHYINGSPNFTGSHGISYLFKLRKHLYAINRAYQIWQINIESFEARQLVII